MSIQIGLFDSVLPNYVQRCLELGATIVKRGKGTVGMILCPSCNSEKGLTPLFENGHITGHACKCGHTFPNEESSILTFQGVKES